MILETYDKELHDKTLRNEGYETGKTAGISSERENGISRLLSALQELNISQRDAYTKLKEKIVQLSKISVWETQTSCASYFEED